MKIFGSFVTNGRVSLVLVADMISAVAVMTAAGLTLLGQEEELRLDIRKESAERVEVNVGFYDDGRFGELREVVNHYDDHLELGLTPAETDDLVEFLKSL